MKHGAIAEPVYPGYSEILVGRARDDTIKSNDPIRNPYPTVLEFLRQRLGLGARQVAALRRGTCSTPSRSTSRAR